MSVPTDNYLNGGQELFITHSNKNRWPPTTKITRANAISQYKMQQSRPSGNLRQETVALKGKSDSPLFNFPTASVLPPLPHNFAIDSDEPEFISICRRRSHYGQEGLFTWDWDEDTWRRYLHAYYRLTEMVDIQVGRVLAALRTCGQVENTLVVLSSDHGEGMGAHHWVVKLGLYEEPARVPLILAQPGTIPAGIVDNTPLTSGIDILPTMCDYNSVSCPDVTGITLRPVVEQPELSSRSYLVSELHPDPGTLDVQGRMGRSEKHKYIAFSTGKNPEQLFDLQSDPGETTDLASNPNYTGILPAHRGTLSSWCTKTEDPFSIPPNIR